MAFITPKTWDVGEVLSAVDMNVYVRDNSNALNFGFRYVARRIYSTPGSYTFSKADPLGDGSLDGSLIRAYRIICVGGGGGGAGGKATGSNQCSPASGGSSGGTSESFRLASIYPASIPVVVGAPGAPGTGADGEDGGFSSFASGTSGGAVSANGGGKGRVRGTVGAAPAMSQGSFLPLSTQTGDVTSAGDAGEGSLVLLVDGSGSSHGGTGGSGKYGSGGPGFDSTTGPTFSDARGFGGGGGGRSVALSSTAAATGGNATGGLVIVELYV